ncbi:MAG: PAS domain-containing sensor histidine kinase [Bacteroidota bacterium]|nr:PAS domain-containing sensor histidine kinase [Bacteroidota bacterium]
MSNERFVKIAKLLAAYAIGDFDKKLAISRRMDDIDSIIGGVNMLGEELKDRTISRDYFNNIFDSVSDMVFVLDTRGKIEDINISVTHHLHYKMDELKGKQINYLLDRSQPGWFSAVLKDIRASRKTGYETIFRTKDNKSIPVLISASSFTSGGSKPKKRVLVTAKDISAQKETQNIVLKAIIETEEKERIRFAKDIHDSIGQQLSAIKFYIGTSADTVEDPRQKEILLKANSALLDVQADMRNICFNIMPKSLEIFGLVKAVKELCSKNELLDQMKIIIKDNPDFPRLPVQQEFALFRIIQEFINNSLKHSKADMLRIGFANKQDSIKVTLSDNGIGFNRARLQKQGMGLNNVQSRILPYKGEVDIISSPGKGTRYEISMPLQTNQ